MIHEVTPSIEKVTAMSVTAMSATAMSVHPQKHGEVGATLAYFSPSEGKHF